MDDQKRDPEDIRKDVTEHLEWDNSLDSRGIHVEVSGDIVTLSGTVSTYGDLGEAERDARVIPGVKLVDNRLSVSPGEKGEVSDDQIRDRVRRVLDWSPAFDASGIHITVRERLVTLTGTVETYWQKSRARALVMNVAGIDEVVDDLKVEPAEGITDEEITEAMDETIERMNLEIGAVDLFVHDGLVTLSGYVSDYGTYCAIEDVAACTNGVREISNELRVG